MASADEPPQRSKNVRKKPKVGRNSRPPPPGRKIALASVGSVLVLAAGYLSMVRQSIDDFRTITSWFREDASTKSKTPEADALVTGSIEPPLALPAIVPPDCVSPEKFTPLFPPKSIIRKKAKKKPASVPAEEKPFLQKLFGASKGATPPG